jgi:phosphosulfolactate phosphohydrolase-like enzyme
MSTYEEPTQEELKKYKDALRAEYQKEMGQNSAHFTDFLVRGMHFLTATLEKALQTIQMYEAMEEIKEIQDKAPVIDVVGEQEAKNVIGKIEGVDKQIRSK